MVHTQEAIPEVVLAELSLCLSMLRDNFMQSLCDSNTELFTSLHELSTETLSDELNRWVLSIEMAQGSPPEDDIKDLCRNLALESSLIRWNVFTSLMCDKIALIIDAKVKSHMTALMEPPLVIEVSSHATEFQTVMITMNNCMTHINKNE